MRSSLAFAALWLALGLSLFGCSSCRKDKDPPGASSSPPLEVAPGQPLSAWTWKTATGQDFAVPSGCQLIQAPLRAAMDTAHLLFLAAPSDIWHLAAATSDDSPQGLSQTRGLVSLPQPPSSAPPASKDIPWLLAQQPPPMGGSSQGWLALLTQNDAFGPQRRLWLWRETQPVQLLAEGDQLAAFDARCEEGACALLTTRPSAVAVPGARLWIGEYEVAPSAYLALDFGQNQGPGIHPLLIAGFEAKAKRASVVFESEKHFHFWDARQGAEAKELGQVPIQDGLLDALEIAGTPFAITIQGKADEQGCAPSDAALLITRPGSAAPSKIALSTLPSSGYARPLEKGGILSWIAPVNCRDPRRKVVTAVRLDSEGRPQSEPMVLGDADGYAIAAQGERVHVYLRDPGGITWLAAKCPEGGK